MTQKISPFLEAKYGWEYGESGWNSGMDENLLKFSLLLDGNIDEVVSSLPPFTEGKVVYLTTDNRLYFGVGGLWLSSPTPKWKEFTVKSTGSRVQYNGMDLLDISSPAEIEEDINNIQATLSSLGSAAFQSVDEFASTGDLDLVEANLSADISQFNSDEPTLGASTVGNAAVSVESIEQLLAFPRKTSLRYLVKGYSTGSSDGGGEFYWDAESTDADDGIFTFEVPGVATGRFKRLAQSISLYDMGVVRSIDTEADDQTDEVIEAIGRLPAGFEGEISAPAGIVFDRALVGAALPLAVVISLEGSRSYIADDPNYRARNYGLVTSDIVSDDTTYSVQSGHHAAFQLFNTRTSGSDSAQRGRGSILWANASDGHYWNAVQPNGMLQFSGDLSGDRWSLGLISFLPWAAIHNGYKVWEANENITLGSIRQRSQRFYRALNSGNSGTTPPTHTAGTETAGGISWQLIFIAESTRFTVSERGEMALNRGSADGVALYVAGPYETNATIMTLASNHITGGTIVLRFEPREAGGPVIPTPSLVARTDGIVAFENSTGQRTIGTDATAAFWQQKKHRNSTVTGSTPDVTGRYSIQMVPGAAITVTNFTTTIAEQEIQLLNAGTADITLSGANFSLTGGTAVLTPWSVITLRKVTANSGRWVEISRSIK